MATNHNCCDRRNVKKGLWSSEEDEKLVNFINKYGISCWSTMPKYAGLERCGKSCRLRWINYLRPDLKRGSFTPQEAALVIECHKLVGNRWSHISHFLPGRTDNEIKNFWNSGLKKKIVAHQKHVQALKKAAAAAAAANFSQNQNLYYVDPNPMILPAAPVTCTKNFAFKISPPAPVYAPSPVEVQASPFSDVPSAWPVTDYNPEIITQNDQNLTYQYDDDFISQFDDPTPPSLNDGNFLNANQDSSIPPGVGETETKEFGVPFSSATQEQFLGQPLISENQGMHAYTCLEMNVPAHHINFFESRMAAFMVSAQSSTSSNYHQLEYPLMDPSPSSDAFDMDLDVATPSSSWDFSEFVLESI